MPATFAHRLMGQLVIDWIQKEIKKDPCGGKGVEFSQKIGEKNNFVIMGATGTDYPYLTDILITSAIQICHQNVDKNNLEVKL